MSPHRRFSRETFEKTSAQIRARMRHLCAHMSAADFESMIEEMTRVKLKYEALTADHALLIESPPKPPDEPR